SAPKGYGLTVLDRDGKDVLRMSAGIAITSQDGGPVDFKSGRKSNIGSISKVITAAAVRHAIELSEDAPAYDQCEVHLDTPFLNVLPAVFDEVDTSGYYN